MVENLLQIVFGLSKDVSNVRCFICLLYPFIPSCLSNVVTRESLRFLSFFQYNGKLKLSLFFFYLFFYFIFIFFSFFLEYIYMKRGMTFRVK